MKLDLFEKFINRSRYDVLVIFVSSLDSEYKVQKLLTDYGFKWGGDRIPQIEYRYNRSGNYHIYADFKNYQLLWSNDIDLYHLKKFEWDNNVYSSEKDFRKIKSFIEYGNFEPSYKPRIIDRTIESINEPSPFKYTEVVIKCSNSEEYKNAQEKLFELDYSWVFGKVLDDFKHREKPTYLFVNKPNKNIMKLRTDDIQNSIVGFNYVVPKERILDRILSVNSFH